MIYDEIMHQPVLREAVGSRKIPPAVITKSRCSRCSVFTTCMWRVQRAESEEEVQNSYNHSLLLPPVKAGEATPPVQESLRRCTLRLWDATAIFCYSRGRARHPAGPGAEKPSAAAKSPRQCCSPVHLSVLDKLLLLQFSVPVF